MQFVILFLYVKANSKKKKKKSWAEMKLLMRTSHFYFFHKFSLFIIVSVKGKNNVKHKFLDKLKNP